MVATNKKDGSKSSSSYGPKKNPPSKNPQNDRPEKSYPSHTTGTPNTENRWDLEKTSPLSYSNRGGDSQLNEDIEEQGAASSPYEILRKKKSKPPKKKNLQGLEDEKLRVNSGPRPGEGNGDEDEDEEEDEEEIGHTKKGNLFGGPSSGY